jgi:hypothetical protein
MNYLLPLPRETSQNNKNRKQDEETYGLGLLRDGRND